MYINRFINEPKEGNMGQIMDLNGKIYSKKEQQKIEEWTFQSTTYHTTKTSELLKLERQILDRVSALEKMAWAIRRELDSRPTEVDSSETAQELV
jgi:hypothetical protein